MAVFSGNGTAAAPSFTFSSDTNTGIYRSAADTLNFVTGGTDWARLTSSGYFGIGTNLTPAATLTLRRNHAEATATTYTGALLIHDEANAVQPHLGAGVAYAGGQRHSWIQSNGPVGVEMLALQPAGGTLTVGRKTAVSTVDINSPAVTSPLRVSIDSSEVASIQSNGAVRIGVNSAPSGSGTGSLAIGGPLTIEASSTTYGSYAVYSEQVTDGSITASTGTIQFDFQSINAAVYFSCLVKVTVALRTNASTTASQPQCVYYFGLHRSNAGVVTAINPTTVYENSFVRATHFAITNPSTNIGRLTLTNPTAFAQGGVYHVEIMSYGGLWQLQSVTTT